MNEIELNSGYKFLLVRAGSTELDDQGRILGALDIPLSKSGEAELKQTASQLVGMNVDTIYSSACQAAQQSAALIGEKLNVKVKVEAKLTNLDCGLWHGKSLEELKETQPTLFRQWKEHPEQICPPCGETIAKVHFRVASALKKLRRKQKAGVVLIVAPEPLLGIIRSELHPLQSFEKPNRLQCGEWELIEACETVA